MYVAKITLDILYLNGAYTAHILYSLAIHVHKNGTTAMTIHQTNLPEIQPNTCEQI